MNTSQLKTFAQETRAKLVSLVGTKLNFVLTADTAELRGAATEVDRLRKMVDERGRDIVVEEVAYTWFNRVMALRFMDANDYNTPKVVSPAPGSNRPEILQDALGGSVSEDLRLSPDDLQLPEAQLYRKLLVASCNQLGTAMPFLFEPILDFTELLLPDDLLSDQSFVTDIRRGMSDEDCLNVEVMGWLYQFYITDRKADAEAKKSKKGGLKSDEQAAATQLFTPHWIVRYMVENSLGRIWMTLHPESELRKQMPYYIDSPDGQTDTIPEHIHEAKDLRFLDPCMGSGHVLVYAFDLLTKMYEEEGYSTREIPAAILTNNLYGIDIDRRCYQLASFALTMKARAYHSRYLRRPVSPKVIALEPISREVIEMSGKWEKDSSMWQFENIDTIGSLLKVTPEECAAITITEGLWAPEQRLLKTQAEYLSAKYDCVVTNPPYLGKGFSDALKEYSIQEYPNSKTDSMAMFMEQCLNMNIRDGFVGMINMQSWMFLTSYEDLRKNLLMDTSLVSLIHLGPHAFDEIPGEKVQCATFIIQNTRYKGSNSIFYRLVRGKNSKEKEQELLNPNKGVVFSHVKQSKFNSLPSHTFGGYWCSDQTIDTFSQGLLSDYVSAVKGLDTCDNNRFTRIWFEVSLLNIGFNIPSTKETYRFKWYPYCKGGYYRKWYGLYDKIVDWENDGETLRNLRDENGKVKSRPQNVRFYFKEGLTWNSLAGENPSMRYMNNAIFGGGGSGMFGQENLVSILAFLNSKVSKFLLQILNPTLNVLVGDLLSLPKSFDEVGIIKQLSEDCISISKSDWDAHETSWDFQYSPLLERMNDCGQNVADLDMLDPDEIAEIRAKTEIPTDSHKLSDVVLAYKHHWERQFHKLHFNEEELNRRFIEIYGLQDELTPDVPLDELTILQKGEISIRDNQIVWNDKVIIKQLISYLIGCFMGRYSVDRPGLIIASQNQDLSALGLEVDGIDNGIKSTIAIDDDGIVPIVEEEDFFPDDMAQRIEAAVRAVFGDKCHYENMRFIEKALGEDLRSYLFKDYYADHQAMYSVKSTRPIYWLFSSKMGDKRKKGYFKALVYMHRMKSDTLSKLHADYVHPYVEKIERQLAEAEDTALRDDLNTAQRKKARDLANLLADKVREVKAFEQELVKMASHRITIDLDDGVRTNYPKFYPLVEPIKGLE